MKKYYYILLTAFSFIFFSCASLDSGSIANSVVLHDGNFVFVERNVRGEASQNHALYWLIGGKRSNMLEDAKRNMMEQHSLTEKQSFANMDVYWDTDMFLWGMWA